MLIKKKAVKAPSRSATFLFPHGLTELATSALKQAASAYKTVASCDRPFILPQKVTGKCGPNLKKLLVRAELQPPRVFPGCQPCHKPSCLIDMVLERGKMITSTETGLAFKIRQNITCSTPSLIYVITCLKCNVQGVGECGDTRSRLTSYITTARDGVIPLASQNCAIHKHFTSSPHQLQDLRITYVEATQTTHSRCSHLYLPTLRKRLEKRWIHRLKAVLNVKREVWYLFSGSEAARGDPNHHRPTEQSNLPPTQFIFAPWGYE